MKKYTFKDFDRDFPTDDACMEWLVSYLYPDGITCPKCGKVTKHHRDAKRPSYSCDVCGHHEHPMAGTIFENSRTSLRVWFKVIYMMASTRCGVSAMQVQRETGVTYKCAWRMCNQIRQMLEEDHEPFDGDVELDETFIGGKAKNMHAKVRRERIHGTGGQDKATAFGMLERGGRVKVVHTADATRESVMPIIREGVLPKANVYTDEARAYNILGSHGYDHRRIHHASSIYVLGDVHTNTIEGFWSLLKRGLSGVYHAVSETHLQGYLDEYAFRYNHREDEQPMFTTMLGQVRKASAAC
jgi:transposase